MYRLLRASAMLLVVASGAIMTGCSSAKDTAGTTTAAAPAPVPAPGTVRKQASNAVPDQNDYPAPTGVKTGVLEGGRK